MKSLPSALATHYAGGTTTIAHALRVIREDGEIYGFTSHDENRTIDGIEYFADPGLLMSEIVIAANLDVGNLELTTLHDHTIFTLSDIMGGVWRNASFLVFRYNWADENDLTLADCELVLAGNMGKVEVRQNVVVAEMRDIRQYMQPEIGDVSQKTCRYRLGDERCKVGLSDFTVSGTITHIINSRREVRDTDRAETEDYFGEGSITFTSGAAAGITAKVAEYNVDGTFRLALPLYVDIEVGDDYIAVAGCRKRLEEDCVPKFGNELNFGGEPDRRGPDNVTKPAPIPED